MLLGFLQLSLSNTATFSLSSTLDDNFLLTNNKPKTTIKTFKKVYSKPIDPNTVVFNHIANNNDEEKRKKMRVERLR